jgi:hypothetical protein
MGGMSGEFLLGCIISFAGTTLGNYGMNLMKYASFKKEKQIAQLGHFKEGLLSLLHESGVWNERYFSVNADHLRYVLPASSQSAKQEAKHIKLGHHVTVKDRLSVDKPYSFDVSDGETSITVAAKDLLTKEQWIKSIKTLSGTEEIRKAAAKAAAMAVSAATAAIGFAGLQKSKSKSGTQLALQIVDAPWGEEAEKEDTEGEREVMPLHRIAADSKYNPNLSIKYDGQGGKGLRSFIKAIEAHFLSVNWLLLAVFRDEVELSEAGYVEVKNRQAEDAMRAALRISSGSLDAMMDKMSAAQAKIGEEVTEERYEEFEQLVEFSREMVWCAIYHNCTTNGKQIVDFMPEGAGNLIKAHLLTVAERKAPLEGEERCTWVLGFSCFVAGQAGILASLGFIDQATSAIFSNVALVTNSIFARYFFNEQFTQADFFAITTILAGSALVVLYYAHVEQDFTLEIIRGYMQEPLFNVFMFGCVSAFLVCLSWKMLRWDGRAGSTAGVVFATMAALVGCCSLTFGKMFIALLKESFTGSNQFTDYLAWVVTVIFITCAVSNVHFINFGLENSPAMVMIPIYYVLITVLATIAGILCFQDFATFEETLNWILFVAGVLLSLVGVVILGQKEGSGEAEAQAKAEENQEGKDPDCELDAKGEKGHSHRHQLAVSASRSADKRASTIKQDLGLPDLLATPYSPRKKKRRSFGPNSNAKLRTASVRRIQKGQADALRDGGPKLGRRRSPSLESLSSTQSHSQDASHSPFLQPMNADNFALMSEYQKNGDKRQRSESKDGTQGTLRAMAAAAAEIKREEAAALQAAAPPRPGGLSGMIAAPSSVAGPPVISVLSPAAKQRLLAQLVEFYQQHNPLKVADAGAVLANDVVTLSPCDESICRTRINWLLYQAYGNDLDWKCSRTTTADLRIGGSSAYNQLSARTNGGMGKYALASSMDPLGQLGNSLSLSDLDRGLDIVGIHVERGLDKLGERLATGLGNAVHHGLVRIVRSAIDEEGHSIDEEGHSGPAGMSTETAGMSTETARQHGNGRSSWHADELHRGQIDARLQKTLGTYAQAAAADRVTTDTSKVGDKTYAQWQHAYSGKAYEQSTRSAVDNGRARSGGAPAPSPAAGIMTFERFKAAPDAEIDPTSTTAVETIRPALGGERQSPYNGTDLHSGHREKPMENNPLPPDNVDNISSGKGVLVMTSSQWKRAREAEEAQERMQEAIAECKKAREDEEEYRQARREEAERWNAYQSGRQLHQQQSEQEELHHHQEQLREERQLKEREEKYADEAKEGWLEEEDEKDIEEAKEGWLEEKYLEAARMTAAPSSVAGPPVISVLSPAAKQRLLAQLVEFYQRYNPDKVAQAGDILTNEAVILSPCDESIFRKRINWLLRKKYGADLGRGRNDKTVLTWVAATPSASAMKAFPLQV